MRRALLPYLVLALGVLCAAEGRAAPITIQYEGTVIDAFFDPFDPFGGSIGFGTPFIGSYTFEATTPDAIPDGSVGSYSNFGAPFGMTLNVGVATFTAGEFLNVGVANDIGAGTDEYTVLAQRGTAFVDPSSVSIELYLADFTGTVFSSDALPLGPVDVGDFSFSSFFLEGTRTVGSTLFQFQIFGTLTEFSAVPAPMTLALFSGGLLAVLAFRRRAGGRIFA